MNLVNTNSIALKSRFRRFCMSVYLIGVVGVTSVIGAAMEPYADASCVLKVNVFCEACKMQVAEVLSSIVGVYSVEVDAREGLAKVYGEVDPNILLMALARSGKHAEIAWVRLKHPVLHNDDYYSSGSCYSRYTRRGQSRYDHCYYHLGRQPFYPRRRTMADHHHPYHCNQCRHGCGGGYGPYAHPPPLYSCADDAAPYCNVM